MAKRGPQREYDEDFRSVLASVDRKGRRQWLYVDVFWGVWRRRRAMLAVFLIGFYLALPFLTVQGKPFFRIDIPDRQFWLFGQVFWPQDIFYLLFFILIGVIGTVAMVSLLGRVFCGWLCPHNVFLEMVFRPIEALFEGKAHRRRQRDLQGDGDKWIRKLGKYGVYLLICGVLANTATAVFVGTDPFIKGLFIDPVNHPEAAVFFAVFFALNYFNFTWFREQTCTIVCPYGRLQSALLDQHTLVVSYDPNRGEPRGKDRKDDGGCIDCFRCVAVCPTGIDIRNGNQLECIHCSACIDACDDVMAKLEQPPGLIRYTAEKTLLGEQRKIWRGRTLLYLVVLTVLSFGTITAVLSRSPLQVVLLRQTAATETITLASGEPAVRHLVNVSMTNKTGADQTVRFSLPTVPEARIVSREELVTLPPNGYEEAKVWLEIPVSAFEEARQGFDLLVASERDEQRLNITLERPDG